MTKKIVLLSLKQNISGKPMMKGDGRWILAVFLVELPI